MTAEEEAKLVKWVMEDSIHTHEECQWESLDVMMALFAAGDVAIPELHDVVKDEAMEEVEEEVQEEQPTT